MSEPVAAGVIRFTESLYPHNGQWFSVDRVICRTRTRYQDLAIVENGVLGRALILDGVLQTTEADEFVYHEMQVHVPVFAHGQAKRVLIIGAGDGGILEEALKHDIERAVMVELDEQVTQLCREHIPSICGGAFEDKRAQVIFGDGAKFVEESDEKFDVIIVDSTDPIGPGEILFREAFYRHCRARMNPGGILVTQNGVPFFQPEELANTYRRLGAVFPDRGFYVMPVPTYYGGFMSLGWASLDPAYRRISRDELANRYAAANIHTRYYNPAIHLAAFALPGYIAEMMA